MKIIELEWCSPEYQAALELRHEVLRAPLGLKLTAAELDGEHAQMHFGIFQDEELIATLVVQPQSAGVAQVRQMAVRPQHQGLGVGTRLMQACETRLRELGFAELVLHARVTSAAFYEKLGYTPVGEIFQEVTVDHQKMTKRLGT